jgi:hypothetical protein
LYASMCPRPRHGRTAGEMAAWRVAAGPLESGRRAWGAGRRAWGEDEWMGWRRPTPGESRRESETGGRLGKRLNLIKWRPTLERAVSVPGQHEHGPQQRVGPGSTTGSNLEHGPARDSYRASMNLNQSCRAGPFSIFHGPCSGRPFRHGPNFQDYGRLDCWTPPRAGTALPLNENHLPVVVHGDHGEVVGLVFGAQEGHLSPPP